MSNDEKIDKLVDFCKASVHITFNDHTTNYQTVKEELTDNFSERYDEVDEAVKKEMIRLNRMVEVQFYTDTPIGFYLVAHHNLSQALDQALEVIDELATQQSTNNEEEK